MTIKVRGLKRIEEAYKRYPAEFRKEIGKTLVIYGNKMENYARANHKYKRKSGNLDAAIQAIVDKGKMVLRFWINPSRVTSGRYNYGVLQHEGTYSKYKPSGIAPKHPKKAAKNGGGIASDWFMLRAWEKYLTKLERGVVKDMIQVTKRVGF